MPSELATRGQQIAAFDRFTVIPPEIVRDVVDTSPTLERWESLPAIADDITFVTKTMAVAYDAAVHSLDRHIRKSRGDERAINAQDLPIGAAIGDPVTGRFFAGFAQDKEFGDPDAHAEVMAIRNLNSLLDALDRPDETSDRQVTKTTAGASRKLAGLTMATTLEPCPNCLEQIEASGISRVTFGASRVELENSEILRRHGLYAPDIVRAGRPSGRYGFEFFKFPDRGLQSACIEIFASFTRNLVNESIEFDPRFGHATRYNLFQTETNEHRDPKTAYDEDAPHQASEIDVLYDSFLRVLDSFNGRSRPAPYVE